MTRTSGAGGRLCSSSWRQFHLGRVAASLQRGCSGGMGHGRLCPCVGLGGAPDIGVSLVFVSVPHWAAQGLCVTRAALGLSHQTSILSSCCKANNRSAAAGAGRNSHSARGHREGCAELSPLGCSGRGKPSPCAAQRGEVGLEEVNYRKCRIGAGNRTNAVVTLGRGCRGAPTAQGGSVQLGHVLLVVLPVSGTGELRSHTVGSPSLAKLREEVTVTGHTNPVELGELCEHHCLSLCSARLISSSRSPTGSRAKILILEAYSTTPSS